MRDIFQLHFGKAREATPRLKELQALERDAGLTGTRLLADVTGPYHTLVVESEVGSLAELEAALAAMGRSEAWRAAYARFTPLVREGRREVFRVLE